MTAAAAHDGNDAVTGGVHRERHHAQPADQPRPELRERPLPVRAVPAGPQVGPPPARPRFEFRERPSTVPTPRPPVVTVAAVLWLAAGSLGVVAALVMLLDLHALEAAVRAVADRDFPQEQQATRDRAVALTSAVLVAGGAVGLAQVGAALRLRAGRGAVRYLLVLLTAAAAVEVVLAVGVVGLFTRLALLLGVACGAVAAVLMYLPPANGWFASRRP